MDLASVVNSETPVSSLAASSADREVHLNQDGNPNEAISMNIDSEPESPHRRGTGILRTLPARSIQEDVSEHQRQITNTRTFPKRRKRQSEKLTLQPSTLDKLIIGIWEQIHGTPSLDPRAIFEQFQVASVVDSSALQSPRDDMPAEEFGVISTINTDSFSKTTLFCRKITQASRICRSIEIIVQARWIELFEEQVQLRITVNPQLSPLKHRKILFLESCQDFGWSEKELRNKMAIWRAYKEVKDAAGWAALVFAGMGIYRFCKYRVDFDAHAMKRLQNLRKKIEVAADTWHPSWRQLLSIVGASPRVQYTGHPHDWVVFEDGSSPVPLRSTYIENDPYFDFEQIEESIVDKNVWGCDDPRWVPQPNAASESNGIYICAICGEQQSDDLDSNSCHCFPSLFGCMRRNPPPVQIFRTSNGRNNGLLALAPFERGSAIGEFVGLITKNIRHVDVMTISTETTSYQIWQGRQGNFTRFVNHSCKANAQFTQFTWLDTQRVVLVSKGIEAGTEISVDYNDRYWAGLDKSCLCGESCCRYKRDSAGSKQRKDSS